MSLTLTEHPTPAPLTLHETTPEPECGPLVWRSPDTGDLLLGGKAMTRQRAIHACLSHTRHQIEADQSGPTRIVYRTLTGDRVVYEGTPFPRSGGGGTSGGGGR